MARKESKLESFRVTLVLSAHMFYTIFTLFFDVIFNIVNTVFIGVAKHSDKLQTILPENVIEFIKTTKKEADIRNESFKAAEEIVNDSFKSYKTIINANNTQESVKEKEDIVIDKAKFRKEIREKAAKGDDLGVNGYVGNIINITIENLHIHNISSISNLNDIIDMLKNLNKRVDELNSKETSVEEMVDLKSRIANYINNTEEMRKDSEDGKKE